LLRVRRVLVRAVVASAAPDVETEGDEGKHAVMREREMVSGEEKEKNDNPYPANWIATPATMMWVPLDDESSFFSAIAAIAPPTA
jgi:hypothetical protein